MEIVGIRREKALRALRAVGVDIREENYNHTDSASHWKTVPDGSVRNGFEVVSPILEGEAGLEQLRVTAAALAALFSFLPHAAPAPGCSQ